MNYLECYQFWCNADLPAAVKDELASLIGNEEELKGRFGSELQFGTYERYYNVVTAIAAAGGVVALMTE